MEIEYCNQDCDLKFEDEGKISKWIEQTIAAEEYDADAITVIFCSDAYLLEINKKYLNHDYYTDIITFDYSEDIPEEGIVAGDLFISIDTVAKNAFQYKVRFKEELHRVIIHGVLHLLGYKDKTPAESIEMRAKEDFYLSKLEL